MPINAVVFDMDGLLHDTEAIYKVAWQQAAIELGFDLDDEAYATFVGRPNEACEMRRVGHAPADCVAFEDSAAGVLAATTAGMTTICVPDLKPLGLGVFTGILVTMWMALFVLGLGFRRSFGASDTAAWLLVCPIVVATFVIVSTLAPSNRAVLYATAVVMAIVAGGCVWIVREAPFVAAAGLLYVGWWFAFFVAALGRASSPGTP